MSLNKPIVLVRVRNRATGDISLTREDWLNPDRYELLDELNQFKADVGAAIDWHYDTLDAAVGKLAAAIVGTPCACGCGGNAAPGKRFIRGHHFRKKEK